MECTGCFRALERLDDIITSKPLTPRRWWWRWWRCGCDSSFRRNELFIARSSQNCIRRLYPRHFLWNSATRETTTTTATTRITATISAQRWRWKWRRSHHQYLIRWWCRRGSHKNVFFSLKSAAKNKISLRCFFTHHQQSREEFLNFFVLPSLLFLLCEKNGNEHTWVRLWPRRRRRRRRRRVGERGRQVSLFVFLRRSSFYFSLSFLISRFVCSVWGGIFI